MQCGICNSEKKSTEPAPFFYFFCCCFLGLDAFRSAKYDTQIGAACSIYWCERIQNRPIQRVRWRVREHKKLVNHVQIIGFRISHVFAISSIRTWKLDINRLFNSKINKCYTTSIRISISCEQTCFAWEVSHVLHNMWEVSNLSNVFDVTLHAVSSTESPLW